MGVGEGVVASGGAGGGGAGAGSVTVLPSGRMSGSALDWQWRRVEGKEAQEADREGD